MKRRSILSVSGTIGLGLALFGITAGSTAIADEIKLQCAVALHPAVDALLPDFEKSSGHKVTVAYGTAGAVADRVQKGEPVDLIITSLSMIDRLQAQGKVGTGDRVIIAKVGVGAFVRKGATKPDISSADAFKRSMLAAKSIAYPDPAGGGASGIYVASLLERLGIAAEMKPKTRLSTLEARICGSLGRIARRPRGGRVNSLNSAHGGRRAAFWPHRPVTRSDNDL